MKEENCLVWHFVKALKKLYGDKRKEQISKSKIRKHLCYVKRVPKPLTNEVINELYQLGFLIRGDTKSKFKLNEEKAIELGKEIKNNKTTIANA